METIWEWINIWLQVKQLDWEPFENPQIEPMLILTQMFYSKGMG